MFIVKLLFLTFFLFVSCSQGDKSIDELIVAFDNAPRTLDSRFAIDANSQYLTNLIYCSLIEYTPDGGYQNQLAEKLEWRDEVSLYISLKDKVRFSDSSVLTAKDIKATFDFFLKNSGESPIEASFKNLKEIEVISPRELLFKLKQPEASFVVNNLGIGILPERLANSSQIKDFSNLISCGPYLLKSFSTQEIQMTKNTKYFLKSGTPKKNDLTIKIIKDEGTRFFKLQKGEIHLSQNISREKVKNIKDYPKLEVLKRLGLNTAYLAFNMKDKVVGNLKVREAISYTIDREAILTHVLGGMGQLADSLLTPESEFYHKGKERKRNLDQARKLLDEAGFKVEGDKPRLVLDYKTTTDTTRVTIAKAIVSQLSEIGIKVNLQTLEWGKFKKDVEEGKAQMWSLKWVGFKDPDIFYYAFDSSNIPPVGGNRGYYLNPSLDTILQAARTTINKEKRKNLYVKAQEILDHDLPYINLWHEEIFAIMNNSLTGYEVYADGRYQSLPLVREK